MNKVFTAAVAALTIGGTIAAAVPAEAQSYRHRDDHRYDRHRNNNNNTGVAIAAGVVGLALGAALASGGRNDNPRYYGNSYYGGDRYARPYSYGYGRPYAYAERPYRVCTVRERVYDPYIDRRVTVRRQYAC
jgi:hypothetical protein